MSKHNNHRRSTISKSEIEKRFFENVKNKDKIEMGTNDDINKVQPIIPFDDFEEDWEDIEETPDYEFLKNLHKFLTKKSFPKKCTRKFMNSALDFVDKNEISTSSLDDFIDNEGLNKKIVDEVKRRRGDKISRSTNSGNSCYTPPYRSHC